MKKFIKISAYILFAFFIISAMLYLIFISITSNVKINENKFTNSDVKIKYYDAEKNLYKDESNGNDTVSITDLKKHTVNAFVAIEDKRFYKHKGIDRKGLVRAVINNLKSFSFKEGASTITQQLVKNTQLTSDKTISRKLKEIKLAKKIEKIYTKEKILEKYLNTIYFGDGCYGIESASKHYFSKKASELTINESAILSSIIKAPSTYSPTKNIDKNLQRKNIVLDKMLEQGYLSPNEHAVNVNKKVELNVSKRDFYDYNSLFKQDINEIIEKKPYNNNLSVYTYLDQNVQNIVKNLLNKDIVNANKSIIVLDKSNNVVAYASTCKEPLRQLGSTIKPLAVYAPALEHGNYYLCSVLDDKKIDINGYSPSNFNDKYYGIVSFCDSLSKSLNSCSVQILNQIGSEVGLNYLKMLGFNVNDQDKNLSLALGSTTNGQKLSTLTSAYSTFRNGAYKKESCLSEVLDSNNQTLYKNLKNEKQIFRNDTANLMKIALKNVVNNGTAKKLKFLPFEVCSKTGTVGNEKGNTDAYNISFNDDYTIGVWYGNIEDSLMPNNVLGGTYPTEIANELWKEIYNIKPLTRKITIENVKEIEIDKLIYKEENRIMLADDNAPQIYKQTEYFGINTPQEKSTKFSNPKIEMPEYSINNNVFSMFLCQTKLYFYDIYCVENDIKTLIANKKPKENFEIKYTLKANKEYYFIIAPYYEINGKKLYGEEILTKKIKLPTDKTDGNWWTDDM